MNNTIDRIKQVILNKSKNAKEFADKIDFPYSTLGNYLNGARKTIDSKLLSKIQYTFEDINCEWLLSGKGQMLKQEAAISYTKGVPYYDIDFIGGFDIVCFNQSRTPDYLIDFEKYNSADCWCNIIGHSMEPEINNGDMIALKEVRDWHLFLDYGEIYAIVTTNDMRTVKRISKGSEKNMLKLIPSNSDPRYSEQEIPVDIVYKIFKVMGCMKRL